MHFQLRYVERIIFTALHTFFIIFLAIIWFYLKSDVFLEMTKYCFLAKRIFTLITVVDENLLSKQAGFESIEDFCTSRVELDYTQIVLK